MRSKLRRPMGQILPAFCFCKLEHSMFIHFHLVYGCFSAIMADLSSWYKERVTECLKYVLFDLYRKFANSYTGHNLNLAFSKPDRCWLFQIGHRAHHINMKKKKEPKYNKKEINNINLRMEGNHSPST